MRLFPSSLSLYFLVPCLLLLEPLSFCAAQERTGEQIYRQLCTRCHGPAGEGTKRYPRPLIGDRSVAQLAALIDKTMPEADPSLCVGEDARKVAAYIHETFYSPVAQARNRPARVELSRMTVRQYRNAVADLIGTFRTPQKEESARGLRAEYYKGRRMRTGERVLERVDPEVQFDFGTSSPDPAKIEPHEYSIRWEGSLVPRETGEYQFVVRTEHAARLWVNEPNQPLLDAWVKSGNETEYRASRFLLAGRAVPLRLEFSRAKQGVDDSKKGAPKPPATRASVALLWKPPQQALEVIPSLNLSTARSPEVFVLTTPFPPDDRSTGWERGTTVSPAWDQATTDAAIETTGYVAARLRELSGVADNAADRNARLMEFATRFAERAFRRPLTKEQRAFFIERQFAEVRDPETALNRVMLLVLKSPRFLYREIGGPDAYDVASRLSFGLWDSLPDRDLLEAAAAGRLASADQVARQVERMLPDPRTRTKLRSFLMDWLKVEQAPDVAKDPRRFPGFDDAVISDLRTSLELFLDEVVWSENSDCRRLLQADRVFLNGRLAKYYGADLPANAPFQPVALGPGERAGVLTHPYLMSAFAYTGESSPIHRGVFLARSVLGVMLRQPPEAVAPLAPDLHPKLTTRERVVMQTAPQACQTCHTTINHLGFTLELFDAVGRYREKENGKPVDPSGTYQTRNGSVVKFAGPRDLGTFLAESEECHAAFVEQLFHSLVKQPVRAYGPTLGEELRRSFAQERFHIRKLVVKILTATAMEQGKPSP